MSCLRTQPLRSNLFRPARLIAFAAATVFCLIVNAEARAQTPGAPTSVLGEVLGNDVSVIGASHVVSGAAGRVIQFSNGGTIVVFSGKARVEFTGGGELDICGPAKFTVLSSGEALTVALSFGRVRVRFDPLRPITIYMPLVIATPIPLGENPRDATIGLTNAGVMCVRAADGAVRLQNQLSGETTIVPQPSEVFIPDSSFASLPLAAGQCRCDFDEPLAQRSSPPPNAPVTSASASSFPIAPLSEMAKPNIAQNSSNRSVSKTPSPQPPVLTANQPAPLKVTLPPIAYDARGATESPEPISVATLMLAQQAVVQPEWIFHGTVTGGRAKKNQLSKTSAAQNSAGRQTPKARGFWAKLRHFFTGS